MPLEVKSHVAGGVTVLTCRGRLVETDSAALASELDSLLPHLPNVVLHLGGVVSIDSSGLGFLVRYLARVRRAGGSLKLCALSPKIHEALRITRIAASFDIYQTEDEATAAFRGGRDAGGAEGVTETDVLVVDQSPDVEAYVRELLRRAGFGVTTASNLPDALILLRAIQPRAVVMGAALRAKRDTETADAFNRMADAVGVVELPHDFSTHDAGDAGRDLLEQVRAVLARR